MRSGWLWRSRRAASVALSVAVLVLLLGAGGMMAWSVASTPLAAADDSELFLEAATSPGQDPFTGDVVLGNPPGTKSQTPRGTNGSGVASLPGDTPALYGGSRNQGVCDRAALVAFLVANPDKAAAWAGVLRISPSAVEQYVATLTPVQLRADTRVTNHGYADGRATPRQSVLEAGTAVLVDETGVPRVKCGCGNPLAEPMALAGSARQLGAVWAGYSKDELTAVTPAPARVDRFVVIDLVTGEPFFRPRGSNGEADAPTVVQAAPFETTTTPPPEPVIECPRGQHRSGDTCVPDQPAPPVCPAGTHLEGSACVPDQPAPAVCPSGTHLQGSSCVPDEPVCPAGTHLQGSSCVPDEPVCSAGTHLEGSSCVPDGPVCLDIEVLEGGECVPNCPEGTHQAGSSCVPDEPECGPDERVENGECVPEVTTCLATHIVVDGECVLPEPDCSEGEQPDGQGGCESICPSDSSYDGGECISDSPPPPPCPSDEARVSNGGCGPGIG